MKRIICCGLGGLWVLSGACSNRSSRDHGYQTNPGTDSSIMIERAIDSASQAGYLFPDTVALRMEPTGRIYWARDSERIAVTALQGAVQDSLLSIFLLSDRLPARLDIHYKGTVTMGIRGAADDELRAAQEVVRNVIAAKRMNTSFGRLNPADRKRFQDSFPVLFQSYY